MMQDGAMSLYQGLSAGVMRQVFYATSRLGLFDVMRDALAKYREIDVWSRLAVGVASGACAAVVSCPAEVRSLEFLSPESLTSGF